MIVGGDTDSNDLTTEVIDMSSNSDNVTSSSIGELPSKRAWAVGGLIGTTPILCGGWNPYHDSCLTLNQLNQWTQTHMMTKKRAYAASVQLNATTLWIIGGRQSSSGRHHDSTEFLSLDSSNGVPGPKLPYALSSSCAVKIAEDQIYVIGGYATSNSRLNRVLIFNPIDRFSYIEGPSLETKRRDHVCGVMSNGQQSLIVVAGGQNGNGYISSVEIFDPSLNNWISGKKYITVTLRLLCIYFMVTLQLLILKIVPKLNFNKICMQYEL